MAAARQLILADASALVAVLDEREHNHRRCADWLRGLRNADLVTTCAAFAEAMYLLGSRYGWRGRRALWDLLERGLLRVAPGPIDFSPVAALMATYRETRMALANAQLMSLAEDLPDPLIFTLDSDFTVYRVRDGSVPKLVP